MNKPANNQSDNLESVTEDLAVNEEQCADVTGGSLGDGSVKFVKDTIDNGAWR
jgi:hypothetical protein